MNQGISLGTGQLWSTHSKKRESLFIYPLFSFCSNGTKVNASGLSPPYGAATTPKATSVSERKWLGIIPTPRNFSRPDLTQPLAIPVYEWVRWPKFHCHCLSSQHKERRRTTWRPPEASRGLPNGKCEKLAAFWLCKKRWSTLVFIRTNPLKFIVNPC